MPKMPENIVILNNSQYVLPRNPFVGLVKLDEERGVSVIPPEVDLNNYVQVVR